MVNGIPLNQLRAMWARQNSSLTKRERGTGAGEYEVVLPGKIGKPQKDEFTWFRSNQTANDKAHAIKKAQGMVGLHVDPLFVRKVN